MPASIKATTTERLGFTGRMEGISAYASRPAGEGLTSSPETPVYKGILRCQVLF